MKERDFKEAISSFHRTLIKFLQIVRNCVMSQPVNISETFKNVSKQYMFFHVYNWCSSFERRKIWLPKKLPWQFHNFWLLFRIQFLYPLMTSSFFVSYFSEFLEIFALWPRKKCTCSNACVLSKWILYYDCCIRHILDSGISLLLRLYPLLHNWNTYIYRVVHFKLEQGDTSLSKRLKCWNKIAKL